MKEVLQRLTKYEQLSKEEAKEVLVAISEGKYNASVISVLMAVFMMRHISVEELAGFREALLELCVPVDLGTNETIDLCGTGGDGKNTFNISTLASFVVAGAGYKVTKHGNYGVSSHCGSSNVLESLGIKFTSDVDKLKTQLDQANICFLHAPLFHPALKNVAGIRKELGVKTFFNVLGPLINPARPKYQLIGVFDLELMRMYGYLHQSHDKQYTIVHSLSGHDELTLTTPCKYISNSGEGYVSATDFSIAPLSEDQLFGGNTVAEAASIFTNVINGKGTDAQQQVVCANAGMAIATIKRCSFPEGYAIAKESLMGGKAQEAFENLLKLSA